jgi:hypothetical protein
MSMDLRKLIGQTVTEINGMEEGSEQVDFITKEGNKLTLYHEQNCCESVYVAQVDGSPFDLIGSPIVMCEEVTAGLPTKSNNPDYEPESFTWTFYKFATVKGYVTLRWYGSSNGYYSESVTCKYNDQEDDRSPEVYDRCVRLLDCCEKAKVMQVAPDTSELSRFVNSNSCWNQFNVGTACDRIEEFLGKLVYPR